MKRLRGFLARLKRESLDLVELVLIPSLAAPLPWPLCFRVFRWVAFHWRFLYREPCTRALSQAHQRGWVDEPTTWLAMRRLVTLVDHADFYLERTRSDRWLQRHVDTDGHWTPPGKAAVWLTFHWGAGLWALRHAAASGLTASFMVASSHPDHFKGRTVLRHYVTRRNASVTRLLGRPTIDVSAPLRPALKVLQAHEQLVAVVDVPSDQVAASQQIQLLGMPARVPRALFRLAVERSIPVGVFLPGICLSTGRRLLRLRDFGTPTDVDALVNEVFAELERAITECPPAWHFWSEADRFFRA